MASAESSTVALFEAMVLIKSFNFFASFEYSVGIYKLDFWPRLTLIRNSTNDSLAGKSFILGLFDKAESRISV